MLLLSYHFPPGQAAGAMRWQKLAGFAHERGWGLDVLTLEPSQLPRRDDQRLEDLPAGSRVYGVASPASRLSGLEVWLLKLKRLWTERSRAQNPEASVTVVAERTLRGGASSVRAQDVRFEMASPRSWLRAYWSWLDFHVSGSWARQAVVVAKQLLSEQEYRVVVSCGPPHMVHEAGRRISRSKGLPWIADLRDPWSQGERNPEMMASPLWYRLAAHYERQMVRGASLIVMNTEPARDALASLFPDHRAKIIAVPNAFDETKVPVVVRGQKFVVAYAGSIYLDRTPGAIFEAVAQLVEEENLEPHVFGIEFMGAIGIIDGKTIEDIAADYDLRGFVETHPPQSFAAAERFLARAAILLSLPQDSHLAIPSKIYEYMRYPAQLLVMAEVGSATELLLRDTPAMVVDPTDVGAILRALRKAYHAYCDGTEVPPVAKEERFSRRARARLLFDEIDRCTISTSKEAGVAAVSAGAHR
jgi:hypothetical protein